jgi:glycosyltransferase involved in cell wall biosynthesis
MPESAYVCAVILFLHNRYRTTGGEERAVEDLLWLVRERLGEDAELLERESTGIARRRAAGALLRGGVSAQDVAQAVRRTGARVVHAHNLNPTFGWRALAAARAQGARVVMHLHQYRLVCAIGVCFTRGAECTRCHGRNTLPGVLLNCRGSAPEAVAYGAALAMWQRRLIANVDAFVVPSQFASQRLHALGAAIDGTHVIPHVIREFADSPSPRGGHALLVARLAPEKGIEIAIEACSLAGIPLVIAGDGHRRSRLAAQYPDVSFVGWVGAEQLSRLRRTAAVALAPSLSAETFGLAAAEAMADGVPVAASRVGALPELVPDEWLVPPGDADALAATISRLRSDQHAGAIALERVRALAAPEVVAPLLMSAYRGELR